MGVDESVKGIYDFKGIFLRGVEEGEFNFADLFNYVNPNIERRKTDKMGMGMFAKKKICKGELILVEKPIVHSDFWGR